MPGKFFLKMCLAAIVVASATTMASAEDKPIQLSLFTPVQIFNEEHDIKGVRLNLIYGRNASLTGLDIGLVNHTTTNPSVGFQYGIVGLSDADFKGWQDNTANITRAAFTGLQSGAFNYSVHLHGLQLGLVNYTETAKGLQIGIINIIKEGGVFTVLPIVNWSF